MPQRVHPHPYRKQNSNMPYPGGFLALGKAGKKFLAKINSGSVNWIGISESDT